NDNGLMENNMTFVIDPLREPPIPQMNATQTGFRSVGAPMGPSAFQNGFSAAQEDIVKYRDAEAAARAMKSAKIAEFEAEDAQYSIDERRRIRNETAERRAGGGGNQEMATVRAEIREIAHQSERRMDMMQQNFEKLLLAISQPKPQDNSMMLV